MNLLGELRRMISNNKMLLQDKYVKLLYHRQKPTLAETSADILHNEIHLIRDNLFDLLMLQHIAAGTAELNIKVVRTLIEEEIQGLMRAAEEVVYG